MPGTKNHSGGARPGAGRPPQTRTLRSGQKLLIHETDTNGDFTIGDLVTVQVVSRTKVYLMREDGSRIIIGY